MEVTPPKVMKPRIMPEGARNLARYDSTGIKSGASFPKRRRSNSWLLSRELKESLESSIEDIPPSLELLKTNDKSYSFY